MRKNNETTVDIYLSLDKYSTTIFWGLDFSQMLALIFSFFLFLVAIWAYVSSYLYLTTICLLLIFSGLLLVIKVERVSLYKILFLKFNALTRAKTLNYFNYQRTDFSSIDDSSNDESIYLWVFGLAIFIIFLVLLVIYTPYV
ncbi:MAG: hypothetical protein KC414_13335 [Romboutsia sp.]|nr:hypothetical protein [Romboutsia sp.]